MARLESQPLDFGAVDWNNSGKCFLAIVHEKEGQLTLSTDAGASWKDLDKGFTHVGILNDKVLLGSRGKGIVRSDDGGGRWSSVFDVTPAASVMRVRDKVCYWPTEQGLLVSKDEGKTWSVPGKPQAGVVGPLWGKSAEHMIVVSKDGFHETKDTGESWKRVAKLPEGFSVGGVGPNYAWDPHADILYASSMGKDTLRLRR